MVQTGPHILGQCYHCHLIKDSPFIPCPYTFKKAFIAKDADFGNDFLKVDAHCKECDSSAIGTMTEPPLEGESSVMIWRAVDTRGVSRSKNDLLLR
ncbi:Protein of unknown function [Gryllus bimaculatus]|nr:Protein of unknown function [Gryllus bimaculatus]